MIREERFIPVTVQRFHPLSPHVSTWIWKEGVFFFFFKAVEREMNLSFMYYFLIFFFYLYHSLLVLHRIDVLLMTSKAQQFCSCKYQEHQMTQAEKFRCAVGVQAQLYILKVWNKPTSKIGARLGADIPWTWW